MQGDDIPAEVAGPAFVPETARLRVLDATLDIIVAITIFGELAAVITDVIGRTLFELPLLWADEVGSLALTTMAFIGGAVAYRRDQHIAVRLLVKMMPGRVRPPIHARRWGNPPARWCLMWRCCWLGCCWWRSCRGSPWPCRAPLD